ncbi:PREDICTED: alpha-2,8-sialyltransferase 8F-like [Branchiostoma belcheri]|uniref:Alpha-2,8-sialyltransferase 8F-like n=1 Tax=Branchiostoma belcheri TaxID=7741 RepID=A0A6P4ZCE4_BRABE|nr:PREDICTED: alpha-2,8-sialyltransferase 8F-like [Branchiostoma belcheri]
MRRRYYALFLMFLLAVPLFLFIPSETVISGYPVRWKALLPWNSSLLKGLESEDHNRTTNTTIVVINTSMETTDMIGRKLTNLEQKLMRRYVPNESVAQKRFQADQEALRSIPTEAPGWVYNQTAADMFRNKTISSRFGNGNFMVTQENTPVNSTLKTYFRKPKTIKVDSKNIFRFLKESPFKNKRFKTCSVVGNGGILKGSGCGEEIDAAEFVFRCNTAPMDDIYWKDIGNRTHLVTMNPGMVYYRYNNFGKSKQLNRIILEHRSSKAFKGARDKFLRDLSAYGDSYLFIEAFLYELSSRRAFLAQKVLWESHAKNTVIYPHPDFVRSTHSYWQTCGVKAPRASTGT